MNEKRTAVMMIFLGAAIAVMPFIFRHIGQDRAGEYIKAFEEGVEENNNGKKEPSPYLKEGAVGLIEIPSLDLKYPVFEGTGPEQLNEGIGHMEATAPLCKKGNCVLAGHNGSRRGVYFTTLSNVELGAAVRITNKEKEVHEYAIAEMRVVSPYDNWVTEESGEEILTLLTCSAHGTRRLAVKCVLIKDYHVEGGDAQ